MQIAPSERVYPRRGFRQGVVGLRLLRRQIFHSAQHDVTASVVETEVLYRVQNDEVGVRENYVGVAVHYLYKEIKLRAVPHFGARGETHENDPVVPPHAHFFEDAYGEVFAQQHTEVGRGDGVGLAFRGEVQPGSARVARGDQTFRPSTGAEKEPDLVRFRLHDLVGARAAKARVEFVCKRAERKVVTAHGYIIHDLRRCAMQKSIAFRNVICYNPFYLRFNQLLRLKAA